MQVFYFKYEIVGSFAQWIIRATDSVPVNIENILRSVENYLFANPLGSEVAGGMYETTEEEMRGYFRYMVHNVPEIKALDSKIDLDGLRLDVFNQLCPGCRGEIHITQE